MKRFVILLLVLIPTLGFAAGTLMKDKNTVPIQMFAPSGLDTDKLTINKRSINASSSVAYAVFTDATACKIRRVAAATGGIVTQRVPVPTGVWNIYGVNSATPFLQFSGCRGNSYYTGH